MKLEPAHHNAFPSLVTTFDIEGHPDEKTVMEMITRIQNLVTTN